MFQRYYCSENNDVSFVNLLSRKQSPPNIVFVGLEDLDSCLIFWHVAVHRYHKELVSVYSFLGTSSSEPFNANGGCVNRLLCDFWQPLEEHVKVKLAQFCHVPVKCCLLKSLKKGSA